MKLPRRHAVLAVQKHPNRWKPLLQRDWGVFKNSAGLQRETRLRMWHVALPDALFRKPSDLLRLANGTRHFAIRPAKVNHELAAMLEVGKVQDRLSEGGMVAHEFSMRPN